MSQSEVLEFLENHKGKWFIARQLSKDIGITQGSCTNNLMKLKRHKLIDFREADKRHTFEYRHKDKNGY